MRRSVALVMIFVGSLSLVLSETTSFRAIQGSEAAQISGGLATCNAGYEVGEKTQCLGACANNPVANNISGGSTNEFVSSENCGNCGGRYSKIGICPINPAD